MLPVTIIIPYHNDSHLMKPALKSAIESDVNEIIIVNDGSEVELHSSVVETICNARICGLAHIKEINLPHNMGLSAARNTGIALARNEFILPLDADDYLYCGAVEALVNGIGTADLAYGDLWDGKEVQIPWTPPVTRDVFMARNPFWATSLFLKSAWQKAGGYTVRPYAHYEDFSLYLDMFLAGCSFRYIPVKVYHHVDRPDSMLKQLHSKTMELKTFATAPLRGECREP